MKKTKIILLGSTGQLGKTLFNKLSKDFDVLTLDRKEINLSKKIILRDYVSDAKPKILINACAYTDVDAAESNPDEAYELNSEFPGFLSEISKKVDCLLVHYSSDYVFDGKKSTPYNEKDNCLPLSIYGSSKLKGEINILESGCRNLILRTSWVYSPYRKNFLLTILNLATKQDQLRIINDQIGCPTSCSLIADITEKMLLKNNQLESGLYHLSSSGKTSWYGFSKEIIRIAKSIGLKLIISERDIIPIETNQYPTEAERPKNSVLDCSKMTNSLDVELLTWQSYLEEVVKEVSRNKIYG